MDKTTQQKIIMKTKTTKSIYKLAVLTHLKNIIKIGSFQVGLIKVFEYNKYLQLLSHEFLVGSKSESHWLGSES